VRLLLLLLRRSRVNMFEVDAGQTSTLSYLEEKRRDIGQEVINIEENVNHLRIDGASARNVDQAIGILQ
jgi:hypothetical protein